MHPAVIIANHLNEIKIHVTSAVVYKDIGVGELIHFLYIVVGSRAYENPVDTQLSIAFHNMASRKIINFSPGPAKIPEQVSR